jgi:hypothetical protein
MPEHLPRRFLLQVKEVELAADPAVIALLGFLQHVEMGFEVASVAPGGAVDALQLLPLRIAAPIGTRKLGQLEGVAHPTGRGHVRPAAEVKPVALKIDPQLLVLGNGLDELDLEHLALGLEHAAGPIAVPYLLGERAVARDDLTHLRLDRREVLGRERLVAEEVVIEAVLDDRPDRHLCAGEQLLHRFRQHVGAVMADELQRGRVVARDDLDPVAVGKLIRKVSKPVVHLHRNGLLGERLGDRRGDDRAGRAVGNLAPCAVWERDRDHDDASAAGADHRGLHFAVGVAPGVESARRGGGHR